MQNALSTIVRIPTSLRSLAAHTYQADAKPTIQGGVMRAEGLSRSPFGHFLSCVTYPTVGGTSSTGQDRQTSPRGQECRAAFRSGHPECARWSLSLQV